MKECDLHSRIDLIIEEDDGELSIANFIPSISNIPKDIFPQYKLYMSFYVFALKELDQYKDKTFKNIYLHSLDDNHREVISYEGDYIDGIIGAIDSNTEDIKNRRWRKELHHCENCEYNGNVCRIN